MMIKIAAKVEDVDIDRLTLMLLDLDKIHHSAAPSRFPLFVFEKRKQDLEKIFEHGHIFYAEGDSQIMGFASVIHKNEKLWIEYLYVQPECRLKKVGAQITKKIFESFPDKEIFASVYAFNDDAIKFYKKMFVLSSLIFKSRM